jgi:flagellar biosynthesis protein FlhF
VPPAGEGASALATERAANAVLNAARDELAAPGTLGEANQWLIEHALRVSQQGAKNAPLTPSMAAAKGLGAPGELTPMPSPASRAPVQRTARAHGTPGSQPALHAHAVPAARSAQGAQPAQAHARAAAPIDVSDDIQMRIAELVKEKVSIELAAMRGMMEEQFATLVWSDRQRARPVQVELSKRLFSAGFSAQLVRMMLDHLPENTGMKEALDWVESTLETNIPLMESEDALMEEGGVFALMGPTGVGKTTTTAKLAARCVMRFGASKVALLTTDSYRIGAHEQLRIYGKILGVSVHAVKDAADLQLALTELRNKHVVLIDTIGMSQRERQLSDQIAMLTGAGRPVKRLLLLNATSHGDTLNEVVQAYRHTPDGAQASQLAGCILTKLDEATNLGAVLDTVIRYKLPVHYVSTGQKVPENLYVATRRFLIKSAFCIPRDASPFVPQEEDLPVLLSALSARSTAELHEVRFG